VAASQLQAWPQDIPSPPLVITTVQGHIKQAEEAVLRCPALVIAAEKSMKSQPPGLRLGAGDAGTTVNIFQQVFRADIRKHQPAQLWPHAVDKNHRGSCMGLLDRLANRG